MLRIRTLTDRFFDGDTTLEEERELYDFYSQDNLPEDLQSYRELFADLAALDATSRASGRTVVTRNHLRRWLSVAAVIVVLLVGGAVVYHHQGEDDCVAYIYGERVTDRSVVLGEMEKTMTAIANDGSDVMDAQLKAMFGK